MIYKVGDVILYGGVTFPSQKDPLRCVIVGIRFDGDYDGRIFKDNWKTDYLGVNDELFKSDPKLLSMALGPKWPLSVDGIIGLDIEYYRDEKIKSILHEHN